jgi:AraC family transcriptional regulator, arabinose operon regulatory protein
VNKPRAGKDAAQQLNPLLPGYSFNLYLVAGLTPIVQGGPLDFFVDRPGGMKGYIINITVQGRGQVFDGDQSFDCEPGDVLLFPPGVPHYYGRAPDSPEWHHRWVYFRPRGFWASWLQWPMQEGQGVGRLHLRDAQVRKEIDSLFVDIDDTHRGGKRTSEELAINLLERLLIRCHEEMPGYQSRPLDARVQAACQFIANNLARELSLDDVARQVCLSPSRLAHLFRDQLGVNIVRWREDQRIILAKHMLQSTTTPVSAIAGRVGYDDQLYFSRVFRKRVGVSPTEFRSSSEEAHDPWGEAGTSKTRSQP